MGPKPQPKNAGNGKKVFKRQKMRDARSIRSQTFDPAFKEGGILNVSEFLKAREFEIKQLEHAQLKSKSASSTRVFQALPRKLRRRTASHNVKRVPKRIRNRALKEMSTDNGLPPKKKHLRGKELYRAKVALKLLKLAGRNTSVKLDLKDSGINAKRVGLRQKIKILSKQISDSQAQHNNKLGLTDNSAVNELAPKPLGRMKYMSRQREFTWLATHVWHAKRSHMAKLHGWQIPYKPTQKCYKLAHRSFHAKGSMIWDTSYFSCCLISGADTANVVSLLTKSKKEGKKLCFIGDRVVGDAVIFWIGEKALVRLHPGIYEEVFAHVLSLSLDVNVEDLRYALGSITLTGPKSLSALSMVLHPTSENNKWEMASKWVQDINSFPTKTCFNLTIKDPRLMGKPRSPVVPRKPNDDELLDLMIELSGSIMESDVFNAKGRVDSYNNMPTLQDIEKRRLTHEPGTPLPFGSKDCTIPVCVKRMGDSWVVFVPWHWQLPIWHYLSKVPGVVHGGLRQLHQKNYEHGELNFPEDMPFTELGYAESLLRASGDEKLWSKKPKAKRMNYSKLDLHNGDYYKGELGNAFASDWQFLRTLRYGLNNVKSMDLELSKTSSFIDGKRELNNLKDVFELCKDQKEVTNVPISIEDGMISTPEDPLTVAPISLRFVSKGHPHNNARVYRVSNLDAWKTTTYKANGRIDHSVNPRVPQATDLIGFVTSGTFHMGEGNGTAVALVDKQFADQDYVIVRNVGSDIARLAKVSCIKI